MVHQPVDVDTTIGVLAVLAEQHHPAVLAAAAVRLDPNMPRSGWQLCYCNWARQTSGSGKEVKEVQLGCLPMLLWRTDEESYLIETLVAALLV